MIRAILHANAYLAPVFFVMAVIFGAGSWWAARHFRLSQWVAVLFSVAMAVEFTATLYPTGHRAGASQVCSYSKDFAAAFASQQGLMNVAMYVPVALFAVLTFRRPLMSLAGCLLLSATTETLQALIPHIGRACDSQDFVTNATGAVVGTGIACLYLRVRKMLSRPTRRELVWSFVPLVTGTLVLTLVQRTAIQPEWQDAPLSDSHSANQRAVAERDARLLFGPSVKIARIQDQTSLGDSPELVITTTTTGQFSFEWPSGQMTNGILSFTALSSSVGSDAEAQTAADTFARRWFPESLPGATVRVYKLDPAKGRRDVEYRRYRKSDGLLEPMRLDIEVDPGGRIAEYTSRNIPDPSIPPAKVSRDQAVAEVTNGHPGQVAAFLLAAQVNGQWRPCWAVTVGNAGPHGTSVLVDAVTGKLIPRQSSQQSGG